METKNTTCTAASHALVQASLPEFRRATTGNRPWADAGLEVAECKLCSSTLAYELPAEKPACYQPYRGLKHNVVDELLKLQARSVAGAAA